MTTVAVLILALATIGNGVAVLYLTRAVAALTRQQQRREATARDVSRRVVKWVESNPVTWGSGRQNPD